MVKLEFDPKKREWIELPKGSRDGIYYDGKLLQKLDNVKIMMKKNWDCLFVVDGFEGAGKSTLAIACAWYISDTKISSKQICSSSEEAKDLLENLPDGSTMVIDEGSLLFSSTEVMRKEQREIIKILNVIRQKRMCLIIVCPEFFNLNKYISCHRSRFLLHVYTAKNLDRGRFAYFGEKKKKQLYLNGKKTYNSYSKPRSNFVGTFRDFAPFGEKYLEVKKKALLGSLKKEQKKLTERDIKIIMVKKLREHLPIVNQLALAKAMGIGKSSFYSYIKETPETKSLVNPPVQVQ